MSQENVQIVSGMYDAFAKGDVEAVLAQMDQSIEWNEAENFLYADRATRTSARRRYWREFSCG